MPVNPFRDDLKVTVWTKPDPEPTITLHDHIHDYQTKKPWEDNVSYCPKCHKADFRITQCVKCQHENSDFGHCECNR